jgi:hypothetical protein
MHYRCTIRSVFKTIPGRVGKRMSRILPLLSFYRLIAPVRAIILVAGDSSIRLLPAFLSPKSTSSFRLYGNVLLHLPDGGRDCGLGINLHLVGRDLLLQGLSITCDSRSQNPRRYGARFGSSIRKRQDASDAVIRASVENSPVPLTNSGPLHSAA